MNSALGCMFEQIIGVIYMSKLTGQFQIKDWQETIQSESENATKRSLATVKLDYSGDIVGTSELQYLLNYQASGNAEFVGFENIQSKSKGQVTLRHLGTFAASVAASQFEVIDCSLDINLIGKKGEFTSGENGVATYIIRLD